MSYSELVDAVDSLSLEEQEEFLNLMHKRIAEDKRNQIIAEAKESVREFESGNNHTSCIDDIMKEILS